MSKYRIFIDFGSTFTKAVAFDMEKEELAARVQTPSTVEKDVMTGLQTALDLLSQKVPVSDADIAGALACSSAAGGLRMVCTGLVPEYTTEAGRLAALGAGAKVVGTYSYEMTGREIAEIERLSPDIILLTGGTDGGNKKVICKNAELLAGSGPGIQCIIAAGNKSAYDELEKTFCGSNKKVVYTRNVMPEFGRLDLEPVNEEIRTLFLNRITTAKGIAKASDKIGGVLMPTPSAVLAAAELLSLGTERQPGFGDLLLVDVGGATTDVFSIGSGRPTRDGAAVSGLIEPFSKRTVEGDLGLFHNLDSLTELAEQTGGTLGLGKEEFESKVAELRALRSIPGSEAQAEYQTSLSALAVKTAVDRHAGRIRMVMTRNGEAWIQQGKDLSKFKTVIGGGGPVAFSREPRRVLSGAAVNTENPDILKPANPAFYLDGKYILFAIGLLAQSEPEKALRIAKKYLTRL